MVTFSTLRGEKLKLNNKAVLCIFTFGVLMITGGILLQDKLESHRKVKKEVVITYASKLSSTHKNVENKNIDTIKETDTISEKDKQKDQNGEQEVAVVETDPIVYDNMTLQQLSEKLDRSLNSTLSGKGSLFASRSVELGIDPYLAVAIVLHETGCKWECSTLVKQCNNVGGQKGGPTCGSGSYKQFDSLDEGINGFLDNLYNNYYAVGLNTPELMNPKYAASTTWATKIYSYMEEIKAK